MFVSNLHVRSSQQSRANVHASPTAPQVVAAEQVPLAMQVVPLAHPAPHIPPQPLEPHTRPAQLGVQVPPRGPQSAQSVPSAQTEKRERSPPSSHSPSPALAQVLVQSEPVLPESDLPVGPPSAVPASLPNRPPPWAPHARRVTRG